MTWANRIRLVLGLLGVLVIVAVCTVALNQRQLRAESTSASIDGRAVLGRHRSTPARSSSRPSSRATSVATGQMLFRVRSPLLARDLASEYVTAADLGVAVEPDGTFPVVATVDGTVSEVLAPVGDFAQAGAVLATVDRARTLTVEAEFILTPRDYGRIAAGSTAEILLPDDRTIQGTVTDIDVDTLDGQATSLDRHRERGARGAGDRGALPAGNAGAATLHLRDDGPFAGVKDMLRDFLRKIGL